MYIYHCCISVRRRGCWHFSKTCPPKSLISPSSGELSPLQCRAAASDESLSVILLTNLSSPTPRSTLTFFSLFWFVPTNFFLCPALRRYARQDVFFFPLFFVGGGGGDENARSATLSPLLLLLLLLLLPFPPSSSSFFLHSGTSRVGRW